MPVSTCCTRSPIRLRRSRTRKLAIAGAVAITLHNILVKSSLLLAGGTIAALAGSDDLKKTAHLYRAAPALAVVFLLQALSLAGFPPLSGFWGKLLLFRATTRRTSSHRRSRA